MKVSSRRSRYYLPQLEALLVTFLWSSSFVLIKMGLADMPPFAFAAVRYGIAFSILGITDLLIRQRKGDASLRTRSRKNLPLLILAGVSGFTVAQGLQFLGLSLLPATTTNLLLSFNPILVLGLGVLFLNEKASDLQLCGLAVAMIGACAFFSHGFSWTGGWPGVSIVLISGFSWAVYMVTIRRLQSIGSFGSLEVTTVTMGIGVVGLLVLAFVFDGFRALTMNFVVIIGWLSVANTAVAFFLWTHAFKSMRAFELSIVQNTMLVQTAILAWVFLGEHLTYVMIMGLALVTLGVVLVQIPAFANIGRPRPES